VDFLQAWWNWLSHLATLLIGISPRQECRSFCCKEDAVAIRFLSYHIPYTKVARCLHDKYPCRILHIILHVILRRPGLLLAHDKEVFQDVVFIESHAIFQSNKEAESKSPSDPPYPSKSDTRIQPDDLTIPWPNQSQTPTPVLILKIDVYLVFVSMILVSKFGDKTFIIALLLSMKPNRLQVALSALTFMRFISAVLGKRITSILPKSIISIAAGVYLLF
jgi:hypothetical protein